MKATVFIDDIPAIKAKVAKVAKRAVKLGLAVPTLHVGPTYYKEVDELNGILLPFVKKIPITDIEIVGDLPKVPGGWEFVARLDIRDKVAMIRSTPNADEIPVCYRGENDGHCDHCKVARRRADVFVLKNPEGEYIQVGRQCLTDYLGENAQRLLHVAKLYQSLDGDLDEFRGFSGRINPSELVFGAKEVLTIASAVVRKYGYVSRRISEEKGFKTTKDDVVDYFIATGNTAVEFRKEIDEFRTDHDKEIAERALAWIKALDVNASEFNYNMRSALMDADAVRVKNFGFIVFAVEAIQREDREKAKAKEFKDEYFGTVGKRVQIHAKLLGVHHTSGYYGPLSIHRFVDGDGHLLIWFGTSGRVFEKDQWHDFKATIKKHQMYKDLKQTVITRVS